MISLIKEKLSSYIGKTLESPQDICAGVMIPIFETDGEAFIVLTKRTETVKAHKGEVSFPGGMCENEDGSKLNTALRECCEEIGLKKNDVKVIGKLDDMITLTGFVISPYVGIMQYPYTFKANPQEVAYIIYLPLNFLMEISPVMERAEYEGRVEEVPSFHYKGDRIWGATCRILLQLRKILTS
jgi:8-oxo-dGTP pyrophosphatase MutT (NUDIX family)